MLLSVRGERDKTRRKLSAPVLTVLASVARLWPSYSFLTTWQPDSECRPLPNHTLDGDGPPQDLQQALHDMQAQPTAGIGARVGPIDLPKGLEDHRLRFHRNSDPGVRH